jgi:membrane protein
VATPRPGKIAALLAWPRRAWALWLAAADNDAGIGSAAIAFFALLGLVPALSAIGLVCGWLSGPVEVLGAFAALCRLMPPETGRFVLKQLAQALAGGGQDGAVALVTTLGFGLYGLLNASQALIDGLNLAYRQTERRTWLHRTAIAAAMALAGAGSVVAMIAAMLIISRFDALLLPVHRAITWLTLAGVTLFVTWLLTMVYRYAPSRPHHHAQRVLPGAITAVILGLVSSAGFALYAAHLANFTATYGVLASVAPILLWLQLCGYAVLLGGSVNARITPQMPD